MQPVARRHLLASLVLALSACGELPETVGVVEQPIINGTLDTTHQAVVAIFSGTGTNSGLCSGTMIKVDPNTHVGTVLTAAHCLAFPAEYALAGDDFSTIDALYYKALDGYIHPSYNGQTASDYDLAVVRVLGVDSTTPTIAALTTAQDTMKVGSAVLSVGYGRTTRPSTGDNNNSRRYRIPRTIKNITATQIGFDTVTGGTCSGDSGGPVLFTVNGQERVGGVHSYHTGDCNIESYSDRVTSADTWVSQQLARAAPAVTCDLCQQIAGSGKQPCAQRRDFCQKDTQCKGYYDCLIACTTTTCANGCKTQFPLGVGPYLGWSTCDCQESCTAECKTEPQCAFLPRCGYAVKIHTICTDCRASSCCTQLHACVADGTCHDCLEKNDAPSACAANGPRQVLAGCLATSCAAECGLLDMAGPLPDMTIVAEPDAIPAATDDAGDVPPQMPAAACTCHLGARSSTGGGLGWLTLLGMAVLLGRRRAARDED